MKLTSGLGTAAAAFVADVGIVVVLFALYLEAQSIYFTKTIFKSYEFSDFFVVVEVALAAVAAVVPVEVVDVAVVVNNCRNSRIKKVFIV